MEQVRLETLRQIIAAKDAEIAELKAACPDCVLLHYKEWEIAALKAEVERLKANLYGTGASCFECQYLRERGDDLYECGEAERPPLACDEKGNINPVCGRWKE